jgi:hypothetical protein
VRAVATCARDACAVDSRAAIVHADRAQRRTGDGLVDLVRVRNGEVCYWPNLGYGRFGRKVTLDHSPRFDTADLFTATRVRFADIDGSGTSDILYLGTDGVAVYFNRSGNALSAALRVHSLPRTDALSRLAVLDLLGRGTACLVWTSSDPGVATPVAYVDLMGGQKPHLLACARPARSHGPGTPAASARAGPPPCPAGRTASTARSRSGSRRRGCNYDAEIKLFDHTLKSTKPGAAGWTYLSVTAPMCSSCTGNLWNTRAALPDLGIITGSLSIKGADPAGLVDGPNLYRYSRNNPIVFVDPTASGAGARSSAVALLARVAIAPRADIGGRGRGLP